MTTQAMPLHAQLFGGGHRYLVDPPVPGTAEALIAPIFDIHAKDCSLGFPPISRRSPVPRRVRRALDETALAGPGELIRVHGQSTLWQVYHENEIQRAAQMDPPVARLLDPDYQTPSMVESDLRFGGSALVRSCAGALDGTVEAKSPPFPPASLQLAVSADMNRKSTITAMSGTFMSPLAAVLERNDWRSRYLRLQLWNLYRTDPSLIGHARYMHNFRGVMLQRIAGLAYNTDLSGSAAASLGVVNAKLKGQLSSGEELNVRELATVIYSDLASPTLRAQRYRRLPTPAELKRDAFGSAAVVALNVEEPMRENQDHNFRFRIDGVPGAVCSRAWEVTPQSSDWFSEGTAPSVTTTTVSAAENNATPACRFDLRWRPRDRDVGRADGQARVRALVQSADALAERGTSVRLEIPIDQMFYSTDLPQLTQRDIAFEQPSTTGTGPGMFSQHWDVELNLQHDPARDPVRRQPGTQIRIDPGAKLVCGTRTIVAGSSIEANSQGIFVLTIATPADLREADYDSAQEACTYTATTRIPMEKRADQVPRNLTARIMMRSPKPPTP